MTRVIMTGFDSAALSAVSASDAEDDFFAASSNHSYPSPQQHNTATNFHSSPVRLSSGRRGRNLL